ncbi:MAG: DUF3570 domain-containing protein [Myxococcales bacterium]|nr:DUF3570 domain-containing protein [Myxococcales bacterium]
MLRRRHPLKACRAGLRPSVLGLGLVLLAGARAQAQVVEVELNGAAFQEPSEKSAMTVYNPGATLTALPWDWLSLGVHYEADIVTGATEPVKAGPLSSPDVISQASITDIRHVVSGSFTLSRKNTSLTAAYSYAAESDYKSQSIAVIAGTDFLQKNTRLELSYARGFDKVCNVSYPPNRDPSVRTPLDSSSGCFTSDKKRQELDIDLDTFSAAWTQAWTPVFTTQAMFTFGLNHGFLGNPYRGVVVGASGQVAQEHHPEDRARFAGAIKAKYFLRGLDMMVGIGARGYRDTWDILSQTYELEAERYMLPWLRASVKLRYYNQTGALFWSDDYTGGEPATGPRGQYWSGDRELSPLKSYLVGGGVLASWKGTREERLAGMLLDFSTGASVDVIKTQLEDFTLAGTAPDDTMAYVLGLSVHGGF